MAKTAAPREQSLAVGDTRKGAIQPLVSAALYWGEAETTVPREQTLAVRGKIPIGEKPMRRKQQLPESNRLL
jgi:hypothetical protein